MSLNEEDPVGAHPDNAMAAAMGANTNFLIMLRFSREKRLSVAIILLQIAQKFINTD